MKLATSLAVLVVSVAGAYASSASAQDVRSSSANATAHCQGALPAFETAIRKRPLAVQNEGSASAFVTCSYEADAFGSDNGILALDTYFTNNTTATVNLTCTAVSGFQGGTNEFVSKTTVLAPGSGANPFWQAAEFDNGLFDSLISISCSLPPGVGINDSYVTWTETAGGAAPN